MNSASSRRERSAPSTAPLADISMLTTPSKCQERDRRKVRASECPPRAAERRLVIRPCIRGGGSPGPRPYREIGIRVERPVVAVIGYGRVRSPRPDARHALKFLRERKRRQFAPLLAVSHISACRIAERPALKGHTNNSKLLVTQSEHNLRCRKERVTTAVRERNSLAVR